MKYIAFIILLYCSIGIQKGISQTQSPNVFPQAIIIDNPMEGGQITVGRGIVNRIFGTVSFDIFNLPNFQYCETEIAIIDIDSTILVRQQGPTFSKDSDFYNQSTVSNAKDFYLDIPTQVLAQLDFNDFATPQKLVIRYKYRVHGDATWSPIPQYNIGEFYTSDVRFGFLLRVVPPTFFGPDIVCNQNNYEIVNPGTIRLENAANIATLTRLGSTNTYRIERIGSASGKVQLISQQRGHVWKKDVVIGTPPPKITGRATVVSGNTYYYAIEKSDPNATLSIDPVVSPGGAPYQISLSGNQITLTTGSLPSNANDYLIRIRATETGECGSATGTLNVRFRGGEGPIH